MFYQLRFPNWHLTFSNTIWPLLLSTNFFTKMLKALIVTRSCNCLSFPLCPPCKLRPLCEITRSYSFHIKRTLCAASWTPSINIFTITIIKMTLGNTSQEKTGGGGLPNFLALFHHVTVPYILTSISYYVILFGHFSHQNYHSHHCRNHCYSVL